MENETLQNQEKEPLTEEQAKGSLRMTVGCENTEAEIDETVSVVKDITEDLRSMYKGR